MNSCRLRSLPLFALFFLFGACTDAPPPPSPPAPEPAPPGPTTEQPASTASRPITVDVKQPDLNVESCLLPFTTEGEARELTIAGKSYNLQGSVLTLTTTDANDLFTFGHLSDIKEDTPENLANIDLLLDWFHKERADALVVTGDLAEGQPAIEKIMRSVAAFKGPVFVMIGNREGKTDFEKAFDAVTSDLPNLVNMNRVRLFNADDVSLISLPGYFNPAYIHSLDGCRYTPDDVRKLDQIIMHAKSTIVVASHGPPRQSGNTSIDRIHEGVNVGDPVLAQYLGEKKLHFGMFGNIHEAGGKATDLSGKQLVRQGEFVDDLYLNSGPTDAVRWPLLDETESIGMGGMIQVKGRQAMYKVRRLRPGEAKPKAAAAAKP